MVPGEKEGYEPCCSGAESCMQALKDRMLVDYDVRRHTGFIVTNVKSADIIGVEWLKTGKPQYELDEVIKFDKELLSHESQSADKWCPEDFVNGMLSSMGKTLEELKELEHAKGDSIKIKINDEEPKESSNDEMASPEAWENNAEFIEEYDKISYASIVDRLATLEDWKAQTQSHLITLSSRINVLELAEVKVDKVKDEADYECDELAKSRPYVEDMMYLSRFFRVGVRRDNKVELTRPDLVEFSKVSASINNNVALRVDSFKHEDIHIAEMSGAIVVVLSARDNPKFFGSMNKEEMELFTRCSEMFSEFDRNDFNFHSDAYCKTGHWKIKREQKLAASSPECNGCYRSFDELKERGETEFGIPIQVHHINDKSYSRIFRESLEDLEVLCKECHGKKHPKKQ